jgi:hypothetical protein
MLNFARNEPQTVSRPSTSSENLAWASLMPTVVMPALPIKRPLVNTHGALIMSETVLVTTFFARR